MSKPIIEVRNLSKKYILGERQPYYSLRDTLSSLVTLPFKKDKLQRDEFWALKDVSFEINEGDVVGVIGRNGAGKSTLLKILSQITPPTEGEIKLRGRVASLLEVGTGFHPELTGRENVYLNGAILGMKRWEINKKFNEIVEFAEIEKFLDTPVKHYSSGMYMRLAFSVAAHLEPEILLIDEVLAVGDAQFQKKCLGKMSDVSKQGRTILFVSHNMAAVAELCKSAILLNQGTIEIVDSTKNVLARYSEKTILSNEPLSNRRNRVGRNSTRFDEIEINNNNPVIGGKKFTANISYKSSHNHQLVNCRVGVTFKNKTGSVLFMCSSDVSEESLELTPNGIIELSISRLPLSAGEYSLDLFIEVNHEVEDLIEDAITFSVDRSEFFGGLKQTPVGFEGRYTLIDHKMKYAF